VLPHLFDRFWQADPARTRSSGAGLGLSIAAAVAEAHHGVIAASKSELGGLEIRLHLPLEIKPFLKDSFTIDSVPI
jgi:signal transduction histidine kinase